ncbi:MAG: class B sortase [Lachnospiraceae bacterium]|nr:class B sortase [Lachnospiraceae bacterium]
MMYANWDTYGVKEAMITKVKTYLKENRFIMILLIVFLIGAAGYGVYELVYETNNARQQTSYEQIWANASAVVAPDADSDSEETEATEPTPIERFLAQGNNRELCGEYLSATAMDFDVLREYNEDVIGYIIIPGTKVSYPILQSEDNNYYLKHNIDGSSGYPGCIYAENYNAATLDDPLTILYGHNMRNNSMFGDLDQYKKEEYRQEHPYVIVYLPEEVRVYEIVVATRYTNEHLLSDRFDEEEDGSYTFAGFAGDEGLHFVEDMAGYNAKGSYVQTDAVTKEDEVLVLSTCTGSDMRYIVGAKRVL